MTGGRRGYCAWLMTIVRSNYSRQWSMGRSYNESQNRRRRKWAAVKPEMRLFVSRIANLLWLLLHRVVVMVYPTLLYRYIYLVVCISFCVCHCRLHAGALITSLATFDILKRKSTATTTKREKGMVVAQYKDKTSGRHVGRHRGGALSDSVGRRGIRLRAGRSLRRRRRLRQVLPLRQRPCAGGQMSAGAILEQK